MSKRSISIILLLLGSLAVYGEISSIDFPTARWFFSTSRDVPLLNWKAEGVEFLWFGWLSSTIMVAVGLCLLVSSFRSGPPNPVTMRRIKRFKEIKRGYYSLIILMGLVGLAALDQLVVGKEALAVRYEGKWEFPAFNPKPFIGSQFGIEGERADAPVNYRKLKIAFKEAGEGGKVIMPLIPYGSTDDTLPPRSRSLVLKDGVYQEDGSNSPYYGLAAKYYDVVEGTFHLRYTLRNGMLSGAVDGWNEAGDSVYTAEYLKGVKLIEKEKYSGEGDVKDFLGAEDVQLRAVKYPPSPPIPEERNWLGTTSQSYDVLAYLYGGLQVNFKAALIFLPIVYTVGIVIGMLMGYLGGWFDLLMDRIIEIFSNMPYLFVVIILSSMVPEQFKGLPIILAILILFGWMGITSLMRTAAYRDKERDYIAASRVLGAGTTRIIFRHLLPNTVAIIVTLVPFTVSALVFSLTALDYLGFGLPPEYATWGRLLNDGLSNLSAPWLVSSTFVVLVGLLILITFIGEAVREAFDPKKYSYYR
ncbi:MAG: ABC transporter permease subunit [Akkermansiaceae bacterium]|jgi:microcin C transport system permease protein|nr:ABC transporter permease subunit [Akkermansiaceae bacterium]MDP4648144.1 ABC transporter permease subunit [Akkermansiaceae bacterium]MDP4720981.1 ABC transporter permease subunit [Akkermansiaceae bacterium]MDP4778928.1 ABC transporter permease subunit [Akkermansiaceae bacterium]MDP4846872.1 ABC transporter permease subunit [Akkermansiaceae bacterium]